MRTLDEIKRQLHPLKKRLHDEFSVSGIELFGSYVRGEQREESDLDVLVDFDRDVSLLDVVGLEQFISDSLGIAVDVVLRRSVRSELRKAILSEAVPV